MSLAPVQAFTEYKTSISDGFIRFSTVTTVPSNEKPVLNFNVNGEFFPSKEEYYTITIEFASDPQNKFSLDLTRITGVYMVLKKVFNAQGNIRRAYSKDKFTIVFEIKNKCMNKKKSYPFSFFISVYDCGCYCNCNAIFQSFKCFNLENCTYTDNPDAACQTASRVIKCFDVKKAYCAGGAGTCYNNCKLGWCYTKATPKNCTTNSFYPKCNSNGDPVDFPTTNASACCNPQPRN